ncbi:uncharacterized protein LOC129762022 [Toxorhynchites rutilus septentrionalis]|uniref:uncharacterized protein LOC129762022 n=1 Tax=Toxorhynchites rutilus septentrionalis TaxID=329112 RepID=UPI0024799B9A|nr:uncharacterized protein LOC129762022 [Toxorhynchites rutilus septentrionalis]XP_055615948.1 uncharacterized protein LOC129762022 [Toxorhynchites rutilus septentrionalis]XP_055615949.1 uncharacterized protein LOC129762022 [Toxorhynchites rutilus septentrionalis]XP_055615950.1 uncharacterized protein LOC129762022 [Toxorhynchites rutilus septentrionalis]
MPPQILPSKMQSREHPFNRSTRPLLERRANMAQPQVLSSKQSNAKKVNPTRGYNDFNLITQQYENINSNNGYPYGSPPSPTSTHLNNYDFQFSDVNGPHYRPVAPVANFFNASTNRNNSDHEDDDDYDELVYRHNQLNVHGGGGGVVVGTANVARRRLIDLPVDARRSPPPPIPPQRIIPVETVPPPPRGDTPENEGPFVFGVHHPNTFTPAYDKAKDVVNSPNSSMQNSSDISSRNTSPSGKERRALVKGKKNSKRTKKDKKKRPEKGDDEKRKESSRSAKEPPNVKCVLVGDGAVGKTNLIVSYIQDRFTPEYVPTAFDKYNVDVSVDGRPICVTLCDTAGQDALDPLRQLCYPGSDVFLLCFSVVQPESFRAVATRWEPEIAKLKASLVLVGTQSDLRNDQSTVLKLQAQGEKPVPVSAAWDFARKIGAKYIETSSHKKERIKEVFDTAIWDALQAREFDRKRPLWKRMLCLTC